MPVYLVIELWFSSPNKYQSYTDGEQLIDITADLIGQEKVIGWFQENKEFGLRALGNRSIIGDACSEKMQSVMNRKIKFRESFSAICSMCSSRARSRL